MLEDRPNLKSTCNDTVWKPKKKEEQQCIFVMYKPVRLQDMYILVYRPIGRRTSSLPYEEGISRRLEVQRIRVYLHSLMREGCFLVMRLGRTE